jgi:hypothetical protein
VLPQAEVLLMVLAIGLYLYDCAFLLHINEGMVVPGQGGGWRIRFGSSHLTFRGKELYMLSPLRPDRPEFRLLWGLPGRPMQAHAAWKARRDLFKPLVPLVWAMAAALFVLLPLGLFAPAGDGILLLALCVLYLGIAGALLWLGRRRGPLGLSARQLGVLAFELAACPPFAVNVIRKVALEMPLDADLMSVARALQAPADWNVTRGELIARLDEQIDAEDESSERMAQLRDSRRKLMADGRCPA